MFLVTAPCLCGDDGCGYHTMRPVYPILALASAQCSANIMDLIYGVVTEDQICTDLARPFLESPGILSRQSHFLTRGYVLVCGDDL